MVRQGKTRCSCLLQTIKSSRYEPLTLVLSHTRLSDTTEQGLFISSLYYFFFLFLKHGHGRYLLNTNTRTPIHPPFFVKNLKAAKQILKKPGKAGIQCHRDYCGLLPSFLIHGRLLFLQDPGFNQQWRMFLESSTVKCSSSVKQVLCLTPSYLQNLRGQQ